MDAKNVSHDAARKQHDGKSEIPHSSPPTPHLKMGAAIEISGFNQTRLLNELSRAGVCITGILRESASKMRLNVSKKHLVKTFAILEKLCYTYTVKRLTTLGGFGRYLLRKSALILSALVCTGLLIYVYGFVWRVEVAGCHKTEAAVIERMLTDCGYGFGRQKSRVDPESVRELVNTLDDVLDTTVEISGITIKVTVTETTDFTPKPKSSPDGIFSRFDAQVTRIEANSGTPLVKVGQRVFEGAGLIGAFRPSQKEEGQFVPAPAQGNVYGIVTFSDTADFALHEYTTARSGKTAKYTDVSFFGLQLPSKDKNKFEKFESVTKSGQAFENFFLPLAFSQTVHYELVDSHTDYDLSERTEFYVNRAIASYAPLIGSAEYTVTTKLFPLFSSYGSNDPSGSGGTEQSGLYRLHVFIQAELLLN